MRHNCTYVAQVERQPLWSTLGKLSDVCVLPVTSYDGWFTPPCDLQRPTPRLSIAIQNASLAGVFGPTVAQNLSASMPRLRLLVVVTVVNEDDVVRPARRAWSGVGAEEGRCGRSWVGATVTRAAVAASRTMWPLWSSARPG